MYPQVDKELRDEKHVLRHGKTVCELYEPFERLWKLHQAKEPNQLSSFIESEQAVFEKWHKKPTEALRAEIRTVRGLRSEGTVAEGFQAFKLSACTELGNIFIAGDWAYLQVHPVDKPNPEHRRIRTSSLLAKESTAETLHKQSALILDGNVLPPGYEIYGSMLSPNQTYMLYKLGSGLGDDGTRHVRHLDSDKNVSLPGNKPFTCSARNITWDHEEKGLFLLRITATHIQFAYRALTNEQEIPVPLGVVADWFDPKDMPYAGLRCMNGYLVLSAKKGFSRQRGGFIKHYIAPLWKVNSGADDIAKVSLKLAPLWVLTLATSICASLNSAKFSDRSTSPNTSN
jgi:hypothetical protein